MTLREAGLRVFSRSSLLAIAAAAGSTTPAAAQEHTEAAVSVELPDATLKAGRDEGSLPFDQLRKNGLVVATKGDAKGELMVFAQREAEA